MITPLPYPDNTSQNASKTLKQTINYNYNGED